MTLFHHVLCSAAFYEPKKADRPENLGKPESEWRDEMLFEQIVNRFNRVRAKPEFTSESDAFEKVKLTGVDYCVEGMLARKAGGEQGQREFAEWAKGDSGGYVSVNILEAMFEDTMHGFDDNAECGYELMLEPPNRLPVAGLDNDTVTEWADPSTGKLTGVDVRLPPFPETWANIYSSWNACFVSGYYKNNLDFYSKLFNPIVAGTYHQAGRSGLYFWPRVFCLNVQLQYLYVARSNPSLPDDRSGTEDWRSDLLSLLWGCLNRAAGQAYQKRIQSALDARASPWDRPCESAAAMYDLKRVLARGIWGQMKAMCTSYSVLGVAGQETVKLFERLKSRGAHMLTPGTIDAHVSWSPRPSSSMADK